MPCSDQCRVEQDVLHGLNVHMSRKVAAQPGKDDEPEGQA